MTNEELVALIQGGDRDKLEQLWGQVERFVAAQANKRLVLSGGLGGVEFGDLYNAGYIAVVAAADTYDPAAGRAFIGWLALALKTAFSQAAGIRSRRQARDPIHQAHSLDAPVGEDTDGNTLADLQADPAAVEAARREAETAMQAKLDAAKAAKTAAESFREEAKRDLKNARESLKKIVAERDALQTQVDKMEKKAALAANEDLMLFRTLLDQVQRMVNQMGGVLLKVRPKDPEKAQGLTKALLALAEKIRGVAAQS